MPFPLAHPAAVLPLRRYCPRQLNFPALVIGSLSPDVGYAFGHLHVSRFSHRFWAGSFGFCLPVGLLAMLMFYILRSPVVGVLPVRYRQVLLPLCQRPIGAPLPLIASLIIGAWTHMFLDSLTHEDGWLAEHLRILQSSLFPVENVSFKVCDLLYAGSTFAGVVWLALCYLRWLEKVSDPPAFTTPGVKWSYALLLAISMLSIALVSRGVHSSLGLIPAGLAIVLLVIGFLEVSGRHIISGWGATH
jgi:hypothetical protein